MLWFLLCDFSLFLLFNRKSHSFNSHDYSRNWGDWDSAKCPGLGKATLAWLIINYSMLGATAVYIVFFIAIAFCECDYDFDDYELKY